MCKDLIAELAARESSINDACIVYDCSDLPIPASSKQNALVEVHLTDVDGVSELENTFTNTKLLDGPLAQCAVIRAREEFANLLN